MTLFGATTAAAIYCGLLKRFGVCAVVMMLVLLIVLNVVHVSAPRQPFKRLVTDLLAGIVLPIGCLFFDPFIFRLCHLATQLGGYALLGTEMLVLFAWITLGSIYGDFLRGTTGSVLGVGCFVCGMFGVLPMLPALIGSLLLQPLAALGYVPWFALTTYVGNARRARRAQKGNKLGKWGFFAGLVILFGIAAFVYGIVYTAVPNARAIAPSGLDDVFPGLSPHFNPWLQ